jgi:hypothetical protein
LSAHHDVGGVPNHESIPREQIAFFPWELRVDALMWLLTDPTRPGGPVMTVDELRRGIESLAPEEYKTLRYYEKWLSSLVAILGEKGVIDRAELERRVAAVSAAHEREHEREHADHAP